MRVKETEFEIQAYLFCALRRLGHEIRGEMLFAVPVAARTAENRRCARVDLCEMDGDRLAAIIEVKRSLRDMEAFKRTKQYAKYAAFNVPIFLIGGMAAAMRFVDQVERRGFLSIKSTKS